MVLPVFAAVKKPLQRSLHGIADVDSIVGRETPNALDGMLGGALALFGQQPTELGETDSADLNCHGDHIGQRFGLALSQPKAYTGDPKHGFHAFMAVPSLVGLSWFVSHPTVYQLTTSEGPPVFLHNTRKLGISQRAPYWAKAAAIGL